MNRVVLAFAAVLLVPTLARAEIQPSFDIDDCEKNASHVVVVSDTGKVLESWRGDLKPGDLLPIKEFHLQLAQEVGRFGKKKGAPERVTGKRLVLFLKRGGSKYGHQPEVGSWAPANWWGLFDTSTVWVEDGHAFALQQWINPGPQVMTHVGTEAEFRARVERINKVVAGLLAKARAEKDLAARAEVLAGVVRDYPGFSPEALAGLEWCGAEAVAAMRPLLGEKARTGDPETFGIYSTMAKIGAPARDDLMRQLEVQLDTWKTHSQSVEWANKLEREESRSYRLLLVVTSNPEAFDKLTPPQQKTLRELRALWADHPVLLKLGEKGDRVHDRLDRVLAKYPR